MDTIHLRSPWLKTAARCTLVAGVLILYFALASISAPKGLADAGGFPTKTPTKTPIPPSPTWTQQALIVAATSTNLPSVATQPLPTSEAPLVIVSTPTPAPARGGGATMACLPLAIILLMGLVIGGAYFYSRRDTTEEYIP